MGLLLSNFFQIRDQFSTISSNLFLLFLNKITPKFYEGIECWKCLETIPPIQSAIEELQGKLETLIREHVMIMEGMNSSST